MGDIAEIIVAASHFQVELMHLTDIYWSLHRDEKSGFSDVYFTLYT